MKNQEETEMTSKNANLIKAKTEKNDEFYTQYTDIDTELSEYLEYNPDTLKDKTVLCPCNDGPESSFTKLFCDMFRFWGLKKLICVSYSKNGHGQAGILDHDPGNQGREQMVWSDLNGNGDFRSEEVTRFLNEADFVITNPPFSLFREFMAWIKKAGDKKFLVIGNKNAVTYKEIFPDIKNNELWFGPGAWASMSFTTPDGEANDIPAIWFTNIDHGIRHEPLCLITMARNIKYGTCKGLREWKKYPKYDNYDAIEVPKTTCIPSDYPGAMGVPISFLGSYCPDQFEIIGLDRYVDGNSTPNKRFTLDGVECYARVVIKYKNPVAAAGF